MFCFFGEGGGRAIETRRLRLLALGARGGARRRAQPHASGPPPCPLPEQVGPDEHTICALSGGVDSTVAATLVHKVLGDRLHCVFVDHGLLRFKVCSVAHAHARTLVPAHAPRKLACGCRSSVCSSLEAATSHLQEQRRNTNTSRPPPARRRPSASWRRSRSTCTCPWCASTTAPRCSPSSRA